MVAKKTGTVERSGRTDKMNGPINGSEDAVSRAEFVGLLRRLRIDAERGDVIM